MSSPAQAISCAVNAQAASLTDSRPGLVPTAPPSPRTDSGRGPRTAEGKSISSQNAITHGLFTDHDFIRPGEQSFYADLDEQLNKDLAPVGMLEYELVNEIRRAMWRLRRCGLVEESMLPATSESGEIRDPMQSESQAKLQLSVDRARNQAHRLLHKCTAELRKLQTERLYRNEALPAGTDLSTFGLADWQSIETALNRRSMNAYRREKLAAEAEIDAILNAPIPPPARPGSFCKTPETLANTPRNAPCPCGSGQKHKRCCGKYALPALHAA